MIAKVLAMKDNLAKIELDGKPRFKVGDTVKVSSAKVRTLPQNSLYWVFLSWLVKSDGGNLKEHGYFTPEALHVALKEYFLSEKKLDKGTFKIIETGSTTDLNSKEFTDYIEQVDHFINDFFGVNTHSFWEEHRSTYSKY